MVPSTTKLVTDALLIEAVCILDVVASTWIPFTLLASKLPVGIVDAGPPRNKVPLEPILAFSVLFVKKPIVFLSVVDSSLTPIYVVWLGPINNLLVTSASLDTDKFPFKDKSWLTINS